MNESILSSEIIKQSSVFFLITYEIKAKVRRKMVFLKVMLETQLLQIRNKDKWMMWYHFLKTVKEVYSQLVVSKVTSGTREHSFNV